MTGTFGSLNIAKTGLQYQQMAIDIADNNIANVTTEGYVRRRADAAEASGASNPTMWSTYAGHGEGVTSTGVQRLSDLLLDTRARREHGSLSYLSVQQASLTRVETGIGEPSDTGVNQAISDFKDALQDLANNPQLPAAREAVLAKANTLAAAVNAQASNISAEQSDLRVNTTNDVTQLNQDATQLAQLNHTIFVASASGTDVSDLMDQRDQLAMDMANLSGAAVSVDASGRYDVSVNGVSLVQGDTAGSMQVATGIDATTGGADGNPLAFQITGPDGTVSRLGASMSGELGGIMVLQNVTLPTYAQGLDQVASKLANAVNTVQQAGYDLNGNPTGTANGASADVPFFTFDPNDPAASLKVAITDSGQIAASATASQTFDGTNADDLAKAADVSDSYQTLVSQMGAVVDGINSQTANQQSLAAQVDDEQQQLTGVSIDEETINLMAAQRAYEASSRVLTTLDSLLDTLINRTGV